MRLNIYINKNNQLGDYLWQFQNEKNQNQSVISGGLIKRLQPLI